jgi:hypothetical protein
MRNWHGMEWRTEMTFFFTPLESLRKEDSSCRVMTLGQTHLEVHGYVHFLYY